LSATLKALCFTIITVTLMPVQWLFLKLWPRGAKHLPHYYHRLMCRLLGIHIVVRGDKPSSNNTLIVSNHVSWLDIPVLSTLMPLSFVAKREVATWPFFGWLAKLQRTVFVNREQRQTTGESRNELLARLHQGDAVVLFPEGTSHTGESLLPFKSSYFAAAVSPDIAIVPVTLAYRRYWGMPMTRQERPTFAWYGDMELVPHLKGFLKAGPITVEVIFHPALDVETGLDRKKAAVASERAIRTGLAAALTGR
jgi:lyso-ornithine lipid O-acyltransferase